MVQIQIEARQADATTMNDVITVICFLTLQKVEFRWPPQDVLVWMCWYARLMKKMIYKYMHVKNIRERDIYIYNMYFIL